MYEMSYIKTCYNYMNSNINREENWSAFCNCNKFNDKRTHGGYHLMRCKSMLNQPLASPLTSLLLSLFFYLCCADFFMILRSPSWSPPETKDSTIDSPDAQRQEWFAQYFSFWLTTNLQTQGFSMSTKL